MRVDAQARGRARRGVDATVDRPPSPDADTSVNILLAVALLALVVRLIYLVQIARAPFFDLRLGDARAYHEWALRIAGGEWIGTDIFYQAPLYPYFLAALYAIVGDGAFWVRFIQAVIGAASCTLLAAAGIALFGRAGAIAGVLLAIYPAAIFQDGLLDKSALVSFFTTALLFVLAARRLTYRAFAAGIILGLLSLTRENALVLAAPIVAWLVLAERVRHASDPASLQRAPLLAAITFLAGCSLVLLPVGARNYAVGGEFLLTTSQFGPNFYIGNHAGATGFYESLVPGRASAADERADAERLAEVATGRPMRPSEVSSYWTGRALDFIRTSPGAWLGLLARKMLLTFNAGEIADTESQQVFAEWSSLLRALALFNFGIVFCAAAISAILTISDWRRLWWLYAIAFTYTLSIAAFYLFARYRFPLVPVLLLIAAGGVATWRRAPARQRRWAGAAVVLAGVVTFPPLPTDRADRIAHYVNVGNELLRNERTRDEAAAFYDRALQESPQSPAAHFGLGTLARLRQQPREAIAHYRTAIEGWPDNADFRLEFAMALEEAGEHQRALDELTAVALLRPEDPSIQIAAGKLLLEQSRPSDAWTAFERALAAQPTNVDALIGSGDALVQLQRLTEAVEKFRRALGIDPRNAGAQERLDRATAAINRR